MYHSKYRLSCIICDEVVFVVKSILLISLLIFAVMGICELIYIIKMFFYYPGIRVNNYTLVVLKSNYAIKQLTFLWQKIRWQGDGYALGIIAITDNIKTKEILICNKFIADKNIILCNSHSLAECKFLQGDF